MRISGGFAKGIPLATPKGLATRPATDSLRQSLFSSLGPKIEGAVCLDLFAGSGSYGLEALSRGAKSCVFVEKHPPLARLLKQNFAALLKSAPADRPLPDCQILTLSIESYLTSAALACNLPGIVFADPPYPITQTAFEFVTDQLSTIGCLICWEAPGNAVLSGGNWKEFKRFGKKDAGPSLRLFQEI